MANILLKYLEERHVPKKAPKPKKKSGPVVTISREYGCQGKTIANRLAKRLENELGEHREWKVISKEILDQAAQSLGLEPEKISYVFNFEKRGIIDDIIAAFTDKYYKSDRKIRNTFRDVIRSFGEEGHSIILGRCGATITRDIEKSLHVRLIAPEDFRIDRISKRLNIPYKDAEKEVQEMDQKRAELRNSFAGRNIDDVDYDLIFNVGSMDDEQIVEMILHGMKVKRII
mgnify:CR=1 FL=1